MPFPRKCRKTVSGGQILLKRKGRLAMKMNITFFMGNEVLNIFYLNNFFEESNIFREIDERFFWGTSIFKEKESLDLTPKMNTTFFIIN